MLHSRKKRGWIGVDVGTRSVKLAQVEFDRTKYLLDRNAAAKAEFDQAERDLLHAQGRLLEIQAIIKEASVMLQIAKDRISAGLDMPICAELR